MTEENKKRDLPQLKMPPISEQGRNLATSAQQAMQGFLQGDDVFVDAFEQQRRYDICQACQFFSRKKSRCAKCGCYLKNKTKWKISTCPIKKW